MPYKRDKEKALQARVAWYAQKPENAAKAKKLSKAWKLRNPDKVKELNKAWRANNLVRATNSVKAWALAHPGNATKWRTAKLEKLAGRKKPAKCEICGSVKKISFEHCHATGVFRGWLCHACNMVLAFARDSSKTLRKLADLVELHERTE